MVTSLADNYVQYPDYPDEWHQQYGQEWKNVVMGGLASLDDEWYQSALSLQSRLHAKAKEVSQMQTRVAEASTSRNAYQQALEERASVSNTLSRLHETIQLELKT